MAVKVASGLSKVASRFLDTAVEAGDMTKDSIVEGLIRTFKVGEKEARDAVEAKLGKPAAEAAPAPKAPSKVTKMKEQGAPKKKATRKPKAAVTETVEDELPTEQPDLYEGYRGEPPTPPEPAAAGLEGLAGVPSREPRGFGVTNEPAPAQSRPGPKQGPQPLSEADFEASTDQRLERTTPRKEVSFPGTTTYPTTEGVPVGLFDRTGKEIVLSSGGVPAKTPPLVEGEYIPPRESSTAQREAASSREQARPRTVAGLLEERRAQEVAPAVAEATTGEAAQTKGQKSFLKNPYILGGLGTAAAAGTTAAMMGREGKTPEGTGQTLEAKTPAQVPVGGEGTKPSMTEPTTPSAGKQAKKPTDVTTSAMGSVAAALNKEQASKKPNASEQTKQTTLDQLDAVVKQVNEDPRFQYQPVRTDLVQLRAEAYKAYKEKANRNEWMDLAEKAINAIGQFASAKAAYGSQFAGGLPLSRTDYGGKTEQAFREYQSELGLIGEQAKAQERAGERLQSEKEKEIARRQRTVLERLDEERLQKKLASNEREAAIRAGAGEDRSSAARNREILKLQLGDIDANIKAKEEEAKTLANALKLGQQVGTGKGAQLDKQVADFASALGTTSDVWKDQADKESGTFTSDKTYLKETIIPQQVKGVEESLAKLRQEIDLMRKQKQQKVQSYIGDQQSAPETAPAAPSPAAGQQPPTSGRVVNKAQLDAYAAQYKMSPDAAAEYLKSKGYTVGR